MERTQWILRPGTKEVRPWNAGWVHEFGWIPYDGPLPVIDPIRGARFVEEGCIFETTVERERIQNEKDEERKNKRKEKIVSALKGIPKIEFATKNGMPNLSVIEKQCGFKPTFEEREEAYADYTSLIKSTIAEPEESE